MTTLGVPPGTLVYQRPAVFIFKRGSSVSWIDGLRDRLARAKKNQDFDELCTVIDALLVIADKERRAKFAAERGERKEPPKL